MMRRRIMAKKVITFEVKIILGSGISSVKVVASDSSINETITSNKTYKVKQGLQITATATLKSDYTIDNKTQKIYVVSNKTISFEATYTPPAHRCDCCGVEFDDIGHSFCPDCRSNNLPHGLYICDTCGAKNYRGGLGWCLTHKGDIDSMTRCSCGGRMILST